MKTLFDTQLLRIFATKLESFFWRGGKKIRKWKKLSENTYFRYESSAMVYTISQNHPECFFLALYHMSPGVENNILAKKYLREGQKICKLKEFI